MLELHTPVAADEPRLPSYAFESFGVRIGISTNDSRVLARVSELPSGQAAPCDFALTDHRYTFLTEDGARFDVRYDVRAGQPAEETDIWAGVAGLADIDVAFALLEPHVHSVIGMYAPSHVFLRAGVVSHAGRLLVLPGKGLTGKTELVAALVDAGATYYSDAFAVIDESGVVHPYAKPLSPRSLVGRPNLQALELTGQRPAPPAAVVFTGYIPGSDWRPRRPTRGESTLLLISEAAPAQERPKDVMRFATRLMDHDPLVLVSERDEADEVVPLLLAELDRQIAQPA